MDKKKVIELIKKGMQYQSKSSHVSSYKEKAKNCFEEALDELKKPDWISVEDELPEYNEKVLVCNKRNSKDFWIDYRSEFQLLGHNFRSDEIYSGGPVTHWHKIDKLEE